jgi:hypothetical protein
VYNTHNNLIDAANQQRGKYQQRYFLCHHQPREQSSSAAIGCASSCKVCYKNMWEAELVGDRYSALMGVCRSKGWMNQQRYFLCHHQPREHSSSAAAPRPAKFVRRYKTNQMAGGRQTQGSTQRFVMFSFCAFPVAASFILLQQQRQHSQIRLWGRARAMHQRAHMFHTGPRCAAAIAAECLMQTCIHSKPAAWSRRCGAASLLELYQVARLQFQQPYSPTLDFENLSRPLTYK